MVTYLATIKRQNGHGEDSLGSLLEPFDALSVERGKAKAKAKECARATDEVLQQSACVKGKGKGKGKGGKSSGK